MLKIFTSYTPGAGKSYAMLEKAMAEQAKGKKEKYTELWKTFQKHLKETVNTSLNRLTLKYLWVN